MGASCSSSNDNIEPFTPRPDGDGDVFDERKALSVTPGSSTASAETGNGSGSGSSKGKGKGNVNGSGNGRGKVSGSDSGNVIDDTAIPGLVQVTSAPTALRLAFPSGSAGGGETERKSEKLTRFKDVSGAEKACEGS